MVYIGKRFFITKKLLLILSFIIIIQIFFQDKQNYTRFELLKDFNVTETFDENVNRKFIVNNKILQYSAYGLINHNENLEIKIFTLFNYIIETDVRFWDSLRCLFILKGENNLIVSKIKDKLMIPFMPYGFNPNLWLLNCEINDESFISQNDDIRIAIIDIRHFDIKGKSSKIDDQNNSQFLIPISNVQFQKPQMKIKKEIKKKRAVVNCVHFMNSINDTRFKNLIEWLHIQKEIGIDKIRIYYYDLDNDKIAKIENIFGTYFVEFIYYSIKKHEICEWHLNRVKQDNNSVIKKKLLQNCLDSHNKIFNFSTGFGNSSHERVNTNDCLYSFKYEYQYLTNYDFDELIFPRKIQNIQDNVPCNKPDHFLKDISIYSYADNLFGYYGRYITASLQFEHVLYAENTSNVAQFIEDILSNTDKRVVRFIISENNYADFEIKKTHFHLRHIKNLKRFYETYKCIISNDLNNSNSDKLFAKWQRSFAFLNIRDGKSIYNTEYTLAINQHFATSTVFATRIQKIPLDMGYSSHIRDQITDFFMHQTYPITFFFLDIEYFKFISNYRLSFFN